MPGVKRAVIVGFDYYGRFLARLINERSQRWRARFYSSTHVDTVRALLASRRADAIISFGGPGPNQALATSARRQNIPVFVIWAGTDVITARSDPQGLELLKRYGFLHLADGPWLVDELRELGINAQYVPVTAVDAPARLAPLPSRLSVLTYLPEPRRAFYGEERIYRLARAFPEVAFRVVGRGDPNPEAPPNVEFLGYVRTMERLIDDSTALVRLPNHDGKSMLVLEVLARGRHVLWNYAFPGVRHVGADMTAHDALARLMDEHNSGRLAGNTVGHHFVRDNFSRAELAARFEEVLERAPRAVAARTASRRIAISGLSLFCAQVAEGITQSAPGWTPNMLGTSSSLEVATSMVSLATADVWYSIGAPIGDRWLHLWGRILRKPRVIHWVGSDIAALRNNRGLIAFCRNPRVVNLAEVEWTQQELLDLGICARIAPLPPRVASDGPLQPLPERFTVLLYVPKTRAELYGRRDYERLIERFRDEPVQFYVVGGGTVAYPSGAQVHDIGWSGSMRELYKRSSALIRFTDRDGLSLMVLEALALGRHVLWSKSFPHVRRIATYEEMEGAVSELLARHLRGDLQPVADAADYVGRHYESGSCIRSIVAAWESA